MSGLPTQYQAYRQATHTVSKTRQIVMLYDGAIRFIQQAREAMVEKRIEDRYNLLVKASAVITGLQSSLDFEAGGDMAHTLYSFYADLEGRITELHRSNDADACSLIIDEMRQMRNAWDEIDKSEAASALPAAPSDKAAASEASPMEIEQEATVVLPGNVTLSA